MLPPSPEIAIVDDDSAVLKALARLLKTRSLATRTFQSAPQFLAALGDWRPTCLIADLHMPELTGLDLQYNLLRSGIRIPTIIITAHDEPCMRKRCEAAGAIAYLSKPVRDASLFAAIAAAGSVGEE